MSGELVCSPQGQVLTAEGRGWVLSFVNLSPAALDNGMKKRATKHVFVTSTGDRRKLKVCKDAPPILLWLLCLLWSLPPPASFCCSSS